MKTLLVEGMMVAMMATAGTGVAAAADPAESTRTSDQQLMAELVSAANAAPLVADKGEEGASMRRAPYGSYPRRKGIILVTSDPYKGLIPLGHAAIVYTSNEVIESLAEGVVKRPNNWYSHRKQAYGVTVKGTSATQDASAADWVAAQLGKPYNYNYFDRDTRSKFYCSQLVWAAFKDKYGINLDTWRWGAAIRPMELTQTDKVNLVYRKA